MCCCTILTETKVFPGITRQSFDSMKNSSYSTLVIFCMWFFISALAAETHASEPNAAQVVSQCRNLSLDQSGFEECLIVLERDAELAMAGIETDWAELVESSDGVSDTDSGSSEVERLRLMETQFRDYRDQYCDFTVAGLDEISREPAVQACRISLNRARANELRRLYVERRTRLAHGSFYRGYFLLTDDKGIFQSCDLRQDWIVDDQSDEIESINERYREVTTEVLELVYLEFRGRLVTVEKTRPVMQINRLNLLRPVLDRDCTTAVMSIGIEAVDETELQSADGEAVLNDEIADTEVPDATPVTTEATIDSYGAAGFLYGYFGEWTSACAADAGQVCQAQAQQLFASEGNWSLLIDRSSARSWRIRLMPTTDSHIVDSGIQLSVDGVAQTTIPVASQQMLLNQPLVLLQGEAALQMINRLRTGGTLEMFWNNSLQSSTSVMFSLNGVTLALDYFDSLDNQ